MTDAANVYGQALYELARDEGLALRILGELKVHIDASALQLYVNASPQGADNIAALMQGGKDKPAEE